MGYFGDVLDAIFCRRAVGAPEAAVPQVAPKPVPLKLAARSQIDVGSFAALAAFPSPRDSLNRPIARLGLFCIQRHYFVGDKAHPGQVTQVLAIAPHETLEVVTQVSRRMSREDEFESSIEEERSTAFENRDMLEISDLVARTLTSSSNSSTSASVSGTLGSIDHSGGNSQTEVATSQRASKIMKEVITKAADRMRRSVRVKVRNVLEISEVNSARRQITNTTDREINIAVRSALRVETVFAQALGSQLCLELVLAKPGSVLRNGRVIDSPIPSRPSVPPSLEASSSVIVPADGSFLGNGTEMKPQFEFQLPPSAELDTGATPVGAQFVSLLAFGRLGNTPVDTTNWFDPARFELVSQVNGKATFQLHVLPGQLPPPPGPFNGYMSGITIILRLSLKLRVAQSNIDAWYAQNSQALSANAEAQLDVRQRSPQAMREEERLAVVRLAEATVGTLLGDASIQMEKMFDPSELWYSIAESDLLLRSGGASFVQTKNARPAPLGYSLGWEDQYACEADRLRNIFMNAEFVTVYLPVRAGMERRVGEHLKDIAFVNPVDGSGQIATAVIAATCSYLEARASAATRWRDSDGDRIDPGDVLVDSATLTDAQLESLFVEATYKKPIGKAEELYPLVDRFRITTPIDGFFYERA